MSDTSRQPIRWIRDNIFVTRDGQPHAIWTISGQAYGLATIAQKERVRAMHQEFFQNMIGEFTILGVVASASPESILEKMLRDVPNPSPEWLEECNLTYEELSQFPTGERTYFLIVPLGRLTPREMSATFARQGETAIREMLRLKVDPPNESWLKTWQMRMANVEKNIPAVFHPRRVGSAALRWLTHHLVSRGAEESVPYVHKELGESAGWNCGPTALPEPLVDEGGLTDISDEKLPQTKLFRRRFVKIETGDTEPSYQQFSVLGLTPQAGFRFPDGEFIAAAAGIPRNIDFALRIIVTPAEKVKTKNRRAENNIRDQMVHRQGTEGSLTGTNSDVEKSAEALQEYATELSASDREVEVAASMIFCASGSDAEAAMADMKDLRDYYASDEWILDIPLGNQEKLFWDFWPGSTISSAANEATQITTARNFSMGIPLTNDNLGMSHGLRFGNNITTGRHSPVLVSLGSLTENDMSGSMGFLGDLGTGKSVALKTIASQSIDRGAQLIVTDHSDNQEWAALGRALTTANVIDFMAPEWSLDPLRIYKDDSKRIRETLNLMTMMLGVNATDEMGVVLNSELKKIVQGELNLGSLRELKDHLVSEKIEDHDRNLARQISRLMDIYADLEFGAAFFNEDLPPMDFTAQATIFCTHGMALPTKDQLNNPEARREMDIDKKVGRAVYAYLASVGSSIMYADDSQETLFIVDECHHMTGSPEGEETISTAIKTGRKHKGAVLLGTHAAEELGSEKLRGLIPQRVIFRTIDQKLAAQNLEWLDENYASEEYINLLSKDIAPMDPVTNEVPEHRRGEALFRDQLNRIGIIKVLIPRSPDRAKTVLTTPPKVRETAA
jgi:hypothetical protein